MSFEDQFDLQDTHANIFQESLTSVKKMYVSWSETFGVAQAPPEHKQTRLNDNGKVAPFMVNKRTRTSKKPGEGEVPLERLWWSLGSP